ncbi:Wilms tumor protein 1-interacting protein [Exaiptasia diaphana]|uniref:LIM zinc-binding domain-containing protein n=1 Tax=Exaiptasia diaphana TaxID=2652724 RepID=A0A913XV33_EXADI|nr:Wilms tumor protein 1-interacting protein [Exaiptasia diaphana]KXJ08883.1 Wilms tumor protein 1-interacting protein-like [Exaiptasia diaphana]
MERHSRFTCDFTGTCHKCHCTIRGCESACQALGRIYHARCFYCCICGKELKGQQFYQVQNKIYCKHDFKEIEVNRPCKTCYVCGKVIGDKILETLGRNYHPKCFYCCECFVVLEGVPFTIDENNNVFCLPDYHRKYSPRCDRCSDPIIPQQQSDEIIRVVCNNKQYHTGCFKCEDCGIQLSNEQGRQCFPINNRLYCLKCHQQRITSTNPKLAITHRTAPSKNNKKIHNLKNAPTNDSFSDV